LYDDFFAIPVGAIGQAPQRSAAGLAGKRRNGFGYRVYCLGWCWRGHPSVWQTFFSFWPLAVATNIPLLIRTSVSGLEQLGHVASVGGLPLFHVMHRSFRPLELYAAQLNEIRPFGRFWHALSAILRLRAISRPGGR